MKFGDYIKKHRLAKGLFLTELARRAEISRAYLTQIENNTKEPPSEKILIRFAEELDIPVEVMFRVANGDLFNAEYLEKSIDYGEIYQKLTSIQDFLKKLLGKGGNLTEKAVAMKEIRKLESLKEMLEDAEEIQGKLNNMLKKQVKEQAYPPRVEKIIAMLTEVGDHGQAYVLDQINVYKKYL